MNDVYEAIERLSAELSSRIGRLAGEKGWAHKLYSWMIGNGDARFVMVVATTVSLPGGTYASFTPRPEPDGNAWPIDVRRTDAVKREPWANGLSVLKSEKGFVVSAGNGALSEAALSKLLDELGKQ